MRDEIEMDLCNQELRKNNLKKMWELKTENNVTKIKEITKDCFKNIGAGVNCDDECPIEQLCFYHEERQKRKEKDKGGK